jgi:hypothetical protein
MRTVAAVALLMLVGCASNPKVRAVCAVCEGLCSLGTLKTEVPTCATGVLVIKNWDAVGRGAKPELECRAK